MSFAIRLIGAMIVLAVCLLYFHRFRHFILFEVVKGNKRYWLHTPKDRHRPLMQKNREMIWYIGSIIVAINIILLVAIQPYREYAGDVIHHIDDSFIRVYPLLTSIVGAFIAMWLIFALVSPRLYTSPNAIYALNELDNKRTLMWYIENNSIFENENLIVTAYKCRYLQNNSLQLKEMKLTCNTISFIEGLLSKSNRVIVKLAPNQITKKELTEGAWDLIELNISVTHALSNVTTIFVHQYEMSDIYYAIVHKSKMFSNKKGTEEKELLTLKSQMSRRSMWARRVVELCLVLLIILGIVALTLNSSKPLIVTLFSTLAYSFSVLILIFSSLRFFHQQPVMNNPNDGYAAYRVVTAP